MAETLDVADRTDAIENVLGLDTALMDRNAVRSSVTLLRLPAATPGQLATTLGLPEVAAFFRGIAGRRWRWPVLAEIRRQQAEGRLRAPGTRRDAVTAETF